MKNTGKRLPYYNKKHVLVIIPQPIVRILYTFYTLIRFVLGFLDLEIFYFFFFFLTNLNGLLQPLMFPKYFGVSKKKEKSQVHDYFSAIYL